VCPSSYQEEIHTIKYQDGHQGRTLPFEIGPTSQKAGIGLHQIATKEIQDS